VRQETEVAGVRMCPGDRVLLLWASADRDEAEFPDPDTVDFARPANRHLGFGAGPHRCLGNHLARVELRVALEEIHRRMPDYCITPGEKVVRRPGPAHTIERLPITVLG